MGSYSESHFNSYESSPRKRTSKCILQEFFNHQFKQFCVFPKPESQNQSLQCLKSQLSFSREHMQWKEGTQRLKGYKIHSAILNFG